MRKNNFLRLLVTCVVSGLMAVNVMAERVSESDAAAVANSFMNPVSASSVKKAPAKRMALKKAAAENESLYYVYENADGEGWVMVAADDVVRPILAYSETGHFRTENLPSNISKWLGKYDHFIQKLEADGVVASEETANEWKALRKGVSKGKGDAVIGPLVKTQWDQDAPYWNLCPGSGSTKAYTGCVATAMAQVMNYWQWPKKGTGSHTYQPKDPNSSSGANSKRYGKQTANFGNTTYDWANMLDKYSGSYTNAQATAVATLMFHCGVSCEMMYGNSADGGSGAYTVNYGDWDDHECAQSAFPAFFGYKKDGLTGYMRDGYKYGGTTYYEKWSDAAWTAMIKEELDKNHPIMYAGAGDEGGHSFVCDGYDDADYFHFNWGWSGDNDGYYKLSNLAPGSGGAGGGSYSFSEDQDVIIGIEPDNKDLPMITITWWVNGETTTSSIMQEDPLELPSTPANCSEDQVFVGWTENSSVDGNKPADLFKTAAGKVVTSAVTYYAVFATKTEGGGSTSGSKTFNFAGIAIDEDWENGVAYTTIEDSPVTITAEGGGNNGKWYTSNSSWRMYSGGTVRIAVAGGEVTSVTSTPACNFIINNGEATFSPSARTDFTKIIVEYEAEGGASYSDYTMSCGAVVPCTLTGISLNTSGVTKSFTAGDKFNHNGLIVTASYSDCGDRKVTPTSVSTPDMSTPGTKVVTVTYTEHGVTKTATYDVIVNEQIKFTIRFFNNGQLIDTQQVVEGQDANVPTTPKTCDDYTFVGWFTQELAESNTSKKTWITDFTAVKDQDYFAIYSRTVSEGGTAQVTDKLTRSITGASGTTYSLWSGKKVTSSAVYAGNSAGGNDAIQLRSKGSNSGIVTTGSGGKVKKIVVAWNSNTESGRTLDVYGSNSAYSKAENLFNNSNQGAKLGSIIKGTSTELTITGDYKFVGVRSYSAAMYIDELSITWEAASGSSTIYYSSDCNCAATAIDQTESMTLRGQKILRDGQLYIVVGEKTYTATGAQVK